MYSEIRTDWLVLSTSNPQDIQMIVESMSDWK